jgi:hypothetical protein
MARYGGPINKPMFLNGNSGAEVYLDDEGPSKISKISNFDNNIITFKGPESKMIFEITKEGEIRIGEGYTPTDASEEFLKRLEDKLPEFANMKCAMLEKENKELSYSIKQLHEDKAELRHEVQELRLAIDAWHDTIKP